LCRSEWSIPITDLAYRLRVHRLEAN
jgi:hypothetical protein